MLVVIFISMRLQRAISRPIVALTKAAQQISLSADPSIRVETQASGELKTLQDTFNRMLDRIQQSERATAIWRAAFSLVPKSCLKK
ncbi:MAG: hypothetical protein CMJ64_21965 [Planctomycetaceae bacterium]|jgi:nitrogen fixation/metabolism regulation signal transduction histidine kinase|nr:hypothetical protein [Planctomycetaceae bacterium]